MRPIACPKPCCNSDHQGSQRQSNLKKTFDDDPVVEDIKGFAVDGSRHGNVSVVDPSSVFLASRQGHCVIQAHMPETRVVYLLWRSVPFPWTREQDYLPTRVQSLILYVACVHVSSPDVHDGVFS